MAKGTSCVSTSLPTTPCRPTRVRPLPLAYWLCVPALYLFSSLSPLPAAGTPLLVWRFAASELIGIACATPFNHMLCDRGFIAIDAIGTLRICELPRPAQVECVDALPNRLQSVCRNRSDADHTVRKIPLHSTPHFVARHQETMASEHAPACRPGRRPTR